MPAVNDYSDDEEDQGGVSAGGGHLAGAAGGAAGGGSSAVRPTAQKEPAFVPWSRMVSANSDVSHREANKLAGTVQGDVDKAQKGIQGAGLAQQSAIQSNYLKSDAPTQPFGKVAGGSQQEAPSAFGGGQRPGGFAGNTPRAQPPQSKPMSGKDLSSEQQTITTIDPNRINTDTSSGAPKTSAGALSGGKDLEGVIGSDAWGKLVGDTQRAQGEANALGSQSGVEALLQQQHQPSPNSAMDAALIGGAGGKQFRDTSKQYGGDAMSKALGAANDTAMGRWQKLMGDVGSASAARDAEINASQAEMGRRNAELSAQPGAGGAGNTKPTSSGFVPPGFESYDDFKKKTGGMAGVHDASQDISPVDALLNKFGEEGIYQGGTVAENFRSGTVKGDLDNQNRVNAFKQIESQYGTEAANYLWQWMTEAMWNGMAGQNSGAMYKTLKDAVEAAIQQGNLKRAAPGAAGKQSEIQQLGGAESQDDPEAIRNGLAKGYPYTDASGKTWKTLSEWDEAHRETA